MSWKSILVTATLVAAVALAPACKKSSEGSGSAGSPSGPAAGAAPSGPAVPAFKEQELAFGEVKMKAFVPEGWEEKIETGSFASARYMSPDYNATFEIGETCGGVCEASQWAENAKTDAKDQLDFMNDPQRYQPAADVEVKQNGETAPGTYVLYANTKPKDPKAGGFAQVRMLVWRYGPDWEEIVTCRFEGRAEHAAIADAALKACTDLQRLGPATPAAGN